MLEQRLGWAHKDESRASQEVIAEIQVRTTRVSMAVVLKGRRKASSREALQREMQEGTMEREQESRGAFCGPMEHEAPDKRPPSLCLRIQICRGVGLPNWSGIAVRSQLGLIY